MTTRPTITIDPAVRWGAPHINGISTDAIAGMVMAGESVETVADDYDITRHQVLLACWWEGSAGCYRRQWKAWADQAHTPLSRSTRPVDADVIPDPPARDHLGSR